MFKKTISLAIWFAALLWVGLGVIPSASAAVPAPIPRRGRLLDAVGKGVVGDWSFFFTIYDAAPGGATLWPKPKPTPLERGSFWVKPGAPPPFTAAVFDGTKTAFLGIKVG